MSGIAEDRVVPARQIRIVGNELWERCPFVGGGDESWTVGSDGGRGGTGRLEGIFGPRQLGIGGSRVESRVSVSSSVCLFDLSEDVIREITETHR